MPPESRPMSYSRSELTKLIMPHMQNVLGNLFGGELMSMVDQAAAVAAIRSQIGDFEIRAPMAGQVLRIDGEVGEVAQLGETLAWIGQPRPLQIIAEVNEEDIPLVATGQQALILADAALLDRDGGDSAVRGKALSRLMAEAYGTH